MERSQCYKLRDHKDFPNEVDIPFHSQLQVELLCSRCNAITASGIKDTNGHTFCRKCADVLTDDMNDLTCLICDWRGGRRTMEKNAAEWAIIQEAEAACPNQKVRCAFDGTLKKVLKHYKNCGFTGKAPCSLCGKLLSIKAHQAHISNECPNRIQQCNFCNCDVEACHKRGHEANCGQRPGTCRHCGQEFKTYAQLEREHYPRCPQMPVFCPFKDLGCDFKTQRRSMANHMSDSSHSTVLVEAIRRLQIDNARLKKTIEQEKKMVAEMYEEKIRHLVTKMEDLEKEATAEFNHRVTLEKALNDLKCEVQDLKILQHADKGLLFEHIVETENSVKQLDHELHLEPLTPGFQYLWKLQPYSHLKNGAMATTEEISSGVVYINKPGYAMEFLVGFVRPSAAVTTPQLSFKCRIHGSEYDDMLPWPFKNTILVILINQQEEAASRSFQLNPAEAVNADEAFKKPASNQPNPKFGFSQVISIPLLENGRKGFLFHNCVVFKVVFPPLY
ncbi:TNF receptor-associated factor 6-like [Amblyomma americanum]